MENKELEKVLKKLSEENLNSSELLLRRIAVIEEYSKQLKKEPKDPLQAKIREKICPKETNKITAELFERYFSEYRKNIISSLCTELEARGSDPELVNIWRKRYGGQNE